MNENWKTPLAVILLALLFSCNNESKLKESTITEIDANENASNNGSSTFAAFPFEEINSNFQTSHKDSLKLLQLWRKTAFSLLDTVNTNLSDLKIKNLLGDNIDGSQSIQAGGIYVAPDNSFKIVVVRGESCGAYCNPFWVSELILEPGDIITQVNFKDIETIDIMPDGKYLIKEKSYSRPAAVYSETTTSATLLSIEANTVKYHRFNYKYPKYSEIQNDSTYNPSGKLSLSQEHFIETPQHLTFDKISNKLSYRYATDFSYCCQIDSVYAYQGEFAYKHGKFVHLTEQKKYIEVD